MLNQFKSVKLPTLPTYLAKTTYFAGIRITVSFSAIDIVV